MIISIQIMAEIPHNFLTNSKFKKSSGNVSFLHNQL